MAKKISQNSLQYLFSLLNKSLKMDLRIVNKSEKEAEIFIDGIIGWDDESSWVGMKKQLVAIAESKISKIIVNINSPGGMVNDGLMIHDALKMSKAQIETRVFSMTASAATVIAQSGNVRKMSANALYLIHHAMNLAMGNINDIKVAVDDLEKFDTTLLNIYLKGKGADAGKIKSLMDENNGYGKWIDAEEALSVGLIDEIFEPSKATNMAVPSPEFLAKYKLPQIPQQYMDKLNAQVEDKTLLEKIKALFVKEEKPAEAVIPEIIPEEVKDIEPEPVIEAVKVDDVNDKEIITAKDFEIEALNKKLSDKETELTNVKTDLATAYTKLGQLDASSTIVTGSEGKEGDDVAPLDTPFAKDIELLNAKLNKPAPAKRVKNPEKE